MSLNQIALRCGTDKSSAHHGYCGIYETYFQKLRTVPLTLLEIGVGSYQFFDQGFHSHKMWKEYFTQGRIVGIDIYPKAASLHEGIEFFIGSQTDEPFLKEMAERVGGFDIIIDDGSHHNDHVYKSFEILWPYLRPGGTYVVEDVHTSYYEKYYNGKNDPLAHNTMNYFKRLADHLNYEANGLENKNLDFVHFYKEIIFIRKR